MSDWGQPAQPKLTEHQISTLSKWEAARGVLEAAKETEMTARRNVVAVFFPKANETKEGMNNFALPNGYTLKYGKKLNYKLGAGLDAATRNDAIDDAADRIAAVGNEGAFIVERLIKWSADISVSEYRMLVENAKTSAQAKAMLDALNTVLTIEEGSPSLEIKEPKAKK